MTTTYISIDWGGTNLKGVCFGENISTKTFQLPSSNLKNISQENLVKICHSLYSLVSKFGLPPFKWLIGAAGTGNDSIKNLLSSTLNQVAQSPQDLELYPDFVCNHASAFNGENGILSINGTGSVLYGVKNNKDLRLGGWGFIFDETPSAGFFGKSYLEAVLMGMEGNKNLKNYSENFTDLNGEKIDKNELLNQIYLAPSIQNYLGKYAQRFTTAYDNREPYALDTINTSINKLSKSIEQIAHKLNFEKANICGSGGLWSNWKPFHGLVESQCKKQNIQLVWKEPSLPLYLGAAYHYSKFNKEIAHILSLMTAV